MNSLLFNRSLGSVTPDTVSRRYTSRLVNALQAAPNVRFDSAPRPTKDVFTSASEAQKPEAWAHKAGVNSLVIDKFEGRFMLSGGADPSIHLWDLESVENTTKKYTYTRAGSVPKATGHKFGITHLSYHPFDNKTFLSSSYDHTLKINTTETLKPSGSFNLESIIYSHAISPIADHLLVACATQHPNIRLVDLRSGANSHILAGHREAVLTVAWSPHESHILASAGADCTIRLWDIRKSASGIGVLDVEDSVGVVGYDGYGTGARHRGRGKAHSAAVNGLVWTEDGRHIVSTGHDYKIRVWDASVGANTLTAFGPVVRNYHLAQLQPLLVPKDIVTPGKDIMFFPNPKEILGFDLFEGKLLKRLKALPVSASSRGAGTTKPRVTTLAWRAHNVQMFSSHSDGTIRAWLPRPPEEAVLDEEEFKEAQAAKGILEVGKKRKRNALDEVFKSLTERPITFG
ncbi:MAG: hypothetical protein M1824_003868 [Vezdaea acicularis]|nr:MAG: hypothetical protein M1824_003868 [Vezdaea acicularis]